MAPSISLAAFGECLDGVASIDHFNLFFKATRDYSLATFEINESYLLIFYLIIIYFQRSGVLGFWGLSAAGGKCSEV